MRRTSKRSRRSGSMRPARVAGTGTCRVFADLDEHRGVFCVEGREPASPGRCRRSRGFWSGRTQNRQRPASTLPPGSPTAPADLHVLDRPLLHLPPADRSRPAIVASPDANASDDLPKARLRLTSSVSNCRANHARTDVAESLHEEGGEAYSSCGRRENRRLTQGKSRV